MVEEIQKRFSRFIVRSLFLRYIFTGLILLVFLLNASCHFGVKEKIHETGKEAGEIVGETVQGISAGIETAFAINIEMNTGLKEMGLETGRITLGDSAGGHDNLLHVYIIFNKDLSREISLKVFDNRQKEMGRSKVRIEGKAGEAKYFSFLFDPLTDIDRDSRIIME